jgi:ubiquinone/menaquinone biosynthesis C-methylase UbiE
MTVNYDALAGDYDRRYAVNDYSGVERALEGFLAGARGGRAFEVGCGTGHWLRVCASAGLVAVGVDSSFAMLQRARAAGCTALVHARAERLPCGDGVFARLYCVNALHHFDDRVAFFVEARRVLAPGGQLLTIGLDPHTGIDQWYLYDYFDCVLEADKRRYSSTAEIRAWLHDAGFVAVRTTEVQHLPARLDARAALEEGRLARGVTSQLAMLTDNEYRRGMARIHDAIAAASRRGETLHLTADLRLYGTYAALPD